MLKVVGVFDRIVEMTAMSGAGAARTPQFSEPNKTPGVSIRFRTFWLLSPFWLAAILVLLEHSSSAARAVVQFITNAPF
jgi:hypothetical protein